MGSFFWPSSVLVFISFCSLFWRLTGDCPGEPSSNYRFLKRLCSIAKLLLRSSIFLGGKLEAIEPLKLGVMTFLGEGAPATLRLYESEYLLDLTRLDL